MITLTINFWDYYGSNTVRSLHHHTIHDYKGHIPAIGGYVYFMHNNIHKHGSVRVVETDLDTGNVKITLKDE